MAFSRIRRIAWSAVAAVPLAAQFAVQAQQPAPSPQSVAAAQTPEFFESRVRPILAANCYDCHTDEHFGGLRLDSRNAILKGGNSGPAVVPGDPDKSLLIAAIRQTGRLKMPKGGRLKPDEVDTLVEWIRAGAPWPALAADAATAGKSAVAAEAASATADRSANTAVDKTAGNPPGVKRYTITPEQRAFWAFQPIRKSPAPAVSHEGWSKNDIDRFVLARLEKEGLAPVRAADKLTLIRRATLDLTGLPPTAEEIEAFQHDESPDALAKLIDRLLASPRYGETWGRQWLDVARYGEDDYRSLDPMGRGHNPYPNAYLYRDWVIKAFNDDMPYGQFVKAQLAADLIDESQRVRNLPALGFLGLGPWFYDNGAVEIMRADERHDRVDVVSRGFLGLTVGCARCHDHKYDPIPTSDYYALAGVFLNTAYKEYPLAPKKAVEDYKEQDKKIEKKEKLLAEFLQTESTQLSQTLALQASKYMAAAWRVTGEPKDEQAKVVDDEKLDYELFDRWLKFLARPPKFYPYLTKWQEMVKPGGTADEAKKLADEFQALLLDVMFERKEVNDENDIIKAKALPGTKKKEPAKLPSDFVTNDDFCPGCGLELKSMPLERQNLWTDVFLRDLADGLNPAQFSPDKVKPGLLKFSGWGLERQLSADRRRYIQALRDDIASLRKDQPPHFAYVHGVGDVEKPANLRISKRGSPFNLGDEEPRHFLSILSDRDPAPFLNGSGRLELAEAIVKQPIAIRVIVNRIWKGHFGTGLVDTPSNFGVGGERPTNPELLDYLAQSFIDNGMSIKTLHRDIMLSATYQLSADDDAKNVEKDSGNRLYWRANRHRLAAEQIRDSVLFVSGALDEKMGGPSAPLTPSYARRTVYGKVSRYKLDDYLQLFDFPSPNLSAEKRFTTSVPLQRLFFMNSDFMQQEAELLARRLADEPDTPSRIRKVYRLIFGRAPQDAELAAGIEYLKSEPMKQYDERKAVAEKKTEKDADSKEEAPDDGAKDSPSASDGMMAGVVPGAGKKDDSKKLLPATIWGRYIKVLLSSAEFTFVE